MRDQQKYPTDGTVDGFVWEKDVEKLWNTYGQEYEAFKALLPYHKCLWFIENGTRLKWEWFEHDTLGKLGNFIYWYADSAPYAEDFPFTASPIKSIEDSPYWRVGRELDEAWELAGNVGLGDGDRRNLYNLARHLGTGDAQVFLLGVFIRDGCAKWLPNYKGEK